ncbi:hypothetical protein CLM62_15415 [Streptomyces sp. SA15]|nr:hypothetical protein CLM62_15415 [Streptomyces sp. SA15]
MTAIVQRLTTADWDSWYTTGHPHFVTDKESERFRRTVRPRPGMTAVDLACGNGQWTRQLAAWSERQRGAAVLLGIARQHRITHVRLSGSRTGVPLGRSARKW